MTSPAPILDVRPEPRFLFAHAPGAMGIPLEEIARRSHELPPKGSTVRVFDEEPGRIQAAAENLQRRGYAIEIAAVPAADLTETGPARVRLWQPSPLLVEALGLIAAIDNDIPLPLRERVAEGRVRGRGAKGAPLTLPSPSRGEGERKRALGRALDVACGSGREAVWLAMAGYEVDALDVLPDAHLRAEDLARRSGVAIHTVQQDLRHEALPEFQYDLVTVFRFLHRPALATIRESVAGEGVMVYEAFNRRDTGGGAEKPLKESRTLQDGELAAAFPDFEILLERDGVEREGRVFSQFIGRRR